MANIDITIDLQADAAYIELSSEDVATTVALTKDVNIDLDEQRCVVGIEVLSLAADIPFSDLLVKYHVRSEVVEALMSSVEKRFDLVQRYYRLKRSLLGYDKLYDTNRVTEGSTSR